MEQIDIMPKREGSGPMGTSELLSVGTPLLAVLNLTPIGRGILGAVGTMATIPEASEAGIFTNIAKAKNLGKLKTAGMSIFPDKLAVHEIPTAHWSGTVNTDTMAEAIRNLKAGPTFDIPAKQRTTLFKRVDDIKAARLLSMDQKLATNWDVSDTTSALYGHRDPASYPQGVVAIRDNLPEDRFLSSLAHEYTHLGDEASPLTREGFIGMDRKELAYEDRLTEVKAFLAGSRVNFPATLTNPSSPDFVHPMISYTNGKFSNEPLVQYFNAMKAEGRKYDMKEINKYAFEMQKEIDRLSEKVRVDPVFKHKLDKAVEDIPVHYEGWVYTQNQKKLRGQTRVEKFRRERELSELNDYTEQIKKGK